MGWGRTFLLGDIGNRLDIADVEEEVQRLKRQIAQSTDADVDQDIAIERLIYENAELKIYLSAVLRLLTQKSILSSQEVEEMVNSLDAADGDADGRYDGPLNS